MERFVTYDEATYVLKNFSFFCSWVVVALTLLHLPWENPFYLCCLSKFLAGILTRFQQMDKRGAWRKALSDF